MSDWSIGLARQVWSVQHWSGGYFDISDEGRVVARPDRDPARAPLDLAGIAAEARHQGLGLPVLVRFLDILHDRVDSLCQAFRQAMVEDGYRGGYRAVYPIKVNQQRRVVEEIIRHGNGRVGLEAGSKPELMAVLALTPPGGTVVCNGYKDREYVRLALRGRQLGLQVHLVIEKASELELVLEEAAALGVTPSLGMRVRLATIGAGKWQNTGGEKSKFGLTAAQALAVVDRLRAAGCLDWLRLLHFHLGSQIPNIRDIRRGMREAARYYAELRALGAPVETVDVGGGLGVDYEGSRSRSFCSMNYTVAEYAHNVVHALWQVCEDEGLPHPDIITESGRAMTAHHAVLITDVIDGDRVPGGADLLAPADAAPRVLHELWTVWTGLDRRHPLEAYHDAAHGLAEAQELYAHGVLNLTDRARAERIWQAVCHALLQRLDPRRRPHRELLDELNEKLADKLFCNFSLFQSMPDVWAIDQIFPVLPLQRLDEPPASRAVLQDLTCDSDGCIRGYVDRDGVESTLPLPPWRPGEPYLLGIFLVGAYQEILGDMHNLFGDTHSVNVRLTGEGYALSGAAHGDTITDVLRYVDFDAEVLRGIYRERVVAAAGLDATARAQCLADLEAGLRGYTYLDT
ncbi:biosynthetic arginine decarboxylase [Alkalilimnicola ehrlichii MLHE-1]|uniref:Biosynthetic arginine decarboxylase n=1 Tax=Alkalilimnicola ehrlichii (strain ATCC BAA-1101 / DSM 17681 / MLHE-1) TaxID=187272 RepID=SPEA_ALKEH|nr:biosynthetic arginine decarboxylase [Alkalilimnicola ehrlichii]Q0ACK8.1 RecName: Full=Biosynthetic arginine decarboxylase; Short=ADC [Alkalilimnicola ehrlichii MLHE-1]ABI55429.1 arginine decarboxylase [Alkalilimnicola ehrlichii MLHE-1]